MNFWHRFRDLVIHRILRLDDTPHRIAWGVALGTMVGFTPTLGIQIPIYLLLAAALRANQVAGVPILFISNPFTAVPLYYFVGKVGSFVLHGGEATTRVTEESLAMRLRAATTGADTSADFQRLLDWEFWRGIGRVLADLGDELWVGAFVCGIVAAIPAYLGTRWGVRTFRIAREVYRISRFPGPQE